MQHFDYSRIGLTGSDDLPDPVKASVATSAQGELRLSSCHPPLQVHLPGLPVQIFDARLKARNIEIF